MYKYKNNTTKNITNKELISQNVTGWKLNLDDHWLIDHCNIVVKIDPKPNKVRNKIK